MNAKDLLISIIIPVFNTKKFLLQSIKSASNQTYKKIEIICINDGSTDESITIIHKLMKIDKRIRLINQSNKGLASARNSGILEAKGDILLFLDSDDYISENACSIINKFNKKYNMDIIVFSAKAFPKCENNWLKSNLTINFKHYKNFKASMINNENGVYPYVWRQAYKTALLKQGTLFDESVKYGEDVPFQLCNFPFAKNILFVDNMLYFYRINRKNSLTNTIDGMYKILHHLNIVNSIVKFWDKKNLIKKYRIELLIFILNFIVCPLNYDSFGRTEIAVMSKNILKKYKIIKLIDFANIKILKKIFKLYIYSSNI